MKNQGLRSPYGRDPRSFYFADAFAMQSSIFPLQKSRYRRLRISWPSYISLQRYRQYVATKMMTQEATVTKTARMGRKKRWPERTAIKFAAGTFERIAVILDESEDRMTFMREAVEREIERREAAGKRKRAPKRT
jgi:hypothetical protein